MRNIALTLMYDGTHYHGWQVQKRDITVAETLEKALAHIVNHPVKCTGAGRTDAGVHAEIYVANFRTTSTIPCDRLPLAVNTRLPGDIVVTRAMEVPEEFNAIGSCLKKEYTYRIYNSRIRNALYCSFPLSSSCQNSSLRYSGYSTSSFATSSRSRKATSRRTCASSASSGSNNLCSYSE